MVHIWLIGVIVFLQAMFGLDKYNYTSDSTFHSYSFLSEGPAGVIEKVATFTEIGPGIFNFGFGDLDAATNEILDERVSNNQDTDLIMGTLGSIIFDFTNLNPNVEIFVKGTTKARTRLYQMNINRHWDTISALFNLLGFINGEWVQFQKGLNYEAFLTWRKVVEFDV